MIMNIKWNIKGKTFLSAYIKHNIFQDNIAER